MAKFDFEEYRQPWETGPHWELKREFIEKYQNDYPPDRLLCLAQAYSNKELLHCSYPELVEREIYQLSCQLKGCKRFREAEADLQRRRKEKSEMQPRKAGKRIFSDDVSSKPFKFIKFCSPVKAFDQSNSSNESVKNLNDSEHCDSKAADSEDVMKNSVAEDAESDSATKLIFVNKSSNNQNEIFSLTRSPDLSLMQKLAAAIPKKTGDYLKSIESAIEVSGLENTIKYVFVRENTSVICCQFYVGNTLISTGRETTKKGAKERAVQYGVEILTNLSNLPYKTLEDVKKELENWKKASWSSNMPWSEISSSDLEFKLKILKSQLIEMEKNPANADLHLIVSIVENFLEYTKYKNMPVVQKIQEVASKLKCLSQVHLFHFGEVPDTPLHLRVFYCDFVIKNILICQTKASSKKKAKSDASELGFNLLINLIENCELERQQNVQEQMKSLEKKSESSMHIITDIPPDEKLNNSFPERNSNSTDREHSLINKPFYKESKTENCFNSVAGKIPETKASTAHNKCDSQISSDSKSNPKLFRVNHRLLTNSRNQQLLVYDLSETNGLNIASSIIHISASRCKKHLNYKTEAFPLGASRDSQKIFRCSLTLNKQEIGKAEGYTEKEARSNAAENALQLLQKSFYTVKVKNELQDGFIINRDQLLNADNPSSSLSESNVGCKMLKMMGWTGGGIGKTSGITEPIVTNDHRFGQGLGFSDSNLDQRSFKQKIDALLKDYSLSNTTSDLILSTEFSKEERKVIHNLAARYHLTTVSRGKGKQRQIFIGRKYSPMQLLEHLIEAGGSTPKYELEDRSVSDRTSVPQLQYLSTQMPLFR